MIRFLKFRSANMQGKLFYSYLAVLLSLVVITGIFTVTVLQNTLEREVLALKRHSVAQTVDKMQLITDHILAVSNIYYISADLTKSLTRSSEPGSYQWYQEQVRFSEFFYQYDFAFDWLDYSTAIIGYNGKQFYSFSSDYRNDDSSEILERIRKEDWYGKLMEEEGRVLWLTDLAVEGLIPPEYGKVIYAVRELHSMYTGKSLGILIIGVDVKSFDERLYRGSLSDNEIIYILDEYNRVVSSSSEAPLFPELEYELATGRVFGPEGSGTVKHEGESYQLIWNTAPVRGWKILSLIKRDNLFAIIYTSRRFIFLVLVFCFLSASLVALIMASHLSRPITVLAREMKQVEEGDLSIRSAIDSSDEIGRLAHRFNWMLDRTVELMERNNSINELKRKAELEALQRQVNPHFIYNSLGTIRFMINLESPQAAEKAIISLNKMLRYNMSGDTNLVPLSRELEMTGHYTAIASKQLDRPLKIIREIPEESLALYIPKLIIQPLVENAIFHGIKPTGREGRIVISARLEGDLMVLTVEDNGTGLPFETIEELRYADKKGGLDDRHNGIGLLNIHDRIVLRFGSNYGLFTEECGEGGRLVIKLPQIRSAYGEERE